MIPYIEYNVSDMNKESAEKKLKEICKKNSVDISKLNIVYGKLSENSLIHFIKFV